MILLARFCGLQHDLAPARTWAGQAAEAGVADNDQAQGLLAVFWAMIAAWDGDLHAAVAESERALALLRSAEDPAGGLPAGSIVGVCRGLADQGEAAVSAYQDAIVLAAETGERFRQSFCLAGLGEQALLRGEPERAEGLVPRCPACEGGAGGPVRRRCGSRLPSAARPFLRGGRAGVRSFWARRRRPGTRSGCARPATRSPAVATASDGIRQARTLLGKRDVPAGVPARARRSRRKWPSGTPSEGDLDPTTGARVAHPADPT